MRLILLAALLATGCATHRSQTPETRAVAYLVREVPAWSRENGCFSCHNNGDGARALFLAARDGHKVPAKALTDTMAWLVRPAEWDDNKGDPAFSDKRLANIQFAAALRESGRGKDNLATAAARVAGDQGNRGAWEIEPSNPVGSPVTYGTALATYMALFTLDGSGNEEQTRKAWEWFARLEPKNNIAAAALVLASRLDRKRLTAAQVQLSEALLVKSQNPDGGWGPYAHAPSEPFDTAIALLALTPSSATEHGRRYLTLQQQADGSWPATTRPPGGESYAQQVSTTAWALMALLETAP